MKKNSTKARLLKKFESYISFPKKYSSPSENFLNLKPFMKEISRIFVPECQSAKVSPNNLIPSGSFQEKPFRPSLCIKRNSNCSRIREAKSDSTMASIQAYFSSDLSKSPIRHNSVKPPIIKAPIKAKTSEKSLRMYRVKSSKVNAKRTLAETFQDSFDEYFAGISLPRPSKSMNTIKISQLEFILEGSRNSVNAVICKDSKVWAGGKDCSLRLWLMPEIVHEPYSDGCILNYDKKQGFLGKNNSRYPLGSKFPSLLIAGVHRKPIEAIIECGELVISGSSDGVVKFWSTFPKQIKTITTKPGLNSLHSLNDYKLVVAGGEFTFWDVNKQSEFRSSFEDKTCVIGKHSENTYFTGTFDSLVKLWDVRAPRSICRFIGHNDTVTGICQINEFSILSCSEDCCLREWDIRKQEMIFLRKHTKPLKHVLCKNSMTLTGGSEIVMWNRKDKEVLNYHNGSVKSLHLVEGKNVFLAGGWDGKISSWTFNSDGT
ncbi:hypothetical protein SteCoe_15732 [Stentor coeruleus]|uniref:Anaphase-promoting complex subunit 4 WD40 domain-containing protein n=1 Tax=Stentor coeruleus TaxID=5963 RepID=A0A1R2C2X6_9CILI|nr:hypothetical protein SteCoe_15732 [Stentor coeruleus]